MKPPPLIFTIEETFTLKMETEGTSEALVPTYQTTLLHFQEDRNIDDFSMGVKTYIDSPTRL